jgi:hypothetical protein
MALPNLSGSNIQDTYQRILHIENDVVYDGTGSVVFNIETVAQEIQEVLPQAVHKRGDGTLIIKYEKIVPLLIEGIKKQQKQIDELTAEVNNIKSAFGGE